MELTRYQLYYRNNKDSILKKHRIYRKTHPEIIRKQKINFYKNNRLRIRENIRKRYKEDKEYRKILDRRSMFWRRTDKGRYYDIKRAAQRRNLIFSLSFEESLSFKNKPCYYCGDKVLHIGIDRVNNKKGYVFGNMVSCCSFCNRMKMAMTKKQFINQCRKILKRRG